MANAAPVLQQAHDLIEAGDYQAARQILDTVRSSNENNPDFWWVYAHAVDDATEGKAAIDRVRQLAPNYSGLESLSGESPQASGGIKPLRPLAPLPPMGTSEDADEFAETGKEAKAAGGFNPILVGMGLVALIAIVLIIALQGVIGGLGGATGTPQPTDIVDDFSTIVPTSDSQVVTTEEVSTEEVVESEEPTETEELSESEEPSEEEIAFAETSTAIALTNEISLTQITSSATAAVENATATAEAAETEEAVESEEPTETEELAETEELVETEESAATDEALAEVMEELEDFGVPAEGIVEEESSLGESLSITTCTTPGPVANQNIIGILNAMRDAGVELRVEALVFHITDCSNDDVILSLGISAEIVQSYWLGDTTASELLAALRRS